VRVSRPPTLQRLITWVRPVRLSWRAHVAIAILRLLIGFAFLPAGLKKILGQPFTDADKHGAFHDFLHAFYQTGWFYNFVGALQLTAAVLLMTQRFAGLGAAMALPILTAIAAFCWSTGVVVTSIVVTLMWLGTVGLLAWDIMPYLSNTATDESAVQPKLSSHRRLWAFCGFAIIIIYIGFCIFRGEVYRPRRADPSDPAFYLMPLIALAPMVTIFIEKRRRRATNAPAP
jgi:uncharacterized membrane protein YphA (DoxX/SURF4 family)